MLSRLVLYWRFDKVHFDVDELVCKADYLPANAIVGLRIRLVFEFKVLLDVLSCRDITLRFEVFDPVCEPLAVFLWC